ncbi:MAG: BREX system ATP-binding domain-containing protein [Bacillota bacterium]
MISTKKDARIIINALKNGGIPKNYLEELVVGREKEINEFKRNLKNLEYDTGGFKIILDNYGTGKTFLVNLLKEVSLKKDYVVSYFPVDRSFRFNKLDDLYYYIMHNLYIKNYENNASFSNIFDIWISNLKKAPDKMQATNEINYVIKEMKKYNDTFARALLSYIRYKINDDEKMIDVVTSWLSGEKNIPFKMKKKFNVKGSIDKSNVFDFLKGFSKLTDLLGYKGLVVIVDEIDLILNERVDIRKDAYNNIKHIIDLCASGDLNKTFFVLTGSKKIVENEKKGFRSNEALSQRLGQAIDSYSSEINDIRQPIIELSNINMKTLEKLTNKIVKIYKLAFDVKLKISNISLRNWVLYTYQKNGKDVKKLKIREFITRLLQILDTIEQNPNNHIYDKNLKMSYNGKKLIFTNQLIN